MNKKHHLVTYSPQDKNVSCRNHYRQHAARRVRIPAPQQHVNITVSSQYLETKG